VIDSSQFLKVVEEIDRVLKNGGILIIIDFFSETALKNACRHIKEFSAFSYNKITMSYLRHPNFIFC